MTPGCLSARAVADRNIEVTVIVLTGLRRGVEDQIADGMISIVADPQDFARAALERRISDVVIRPFNDARTQGAPLSKEDSPLE